VKFSMIKTLTFSWLAAGVDRGRRVRTMIDVMSGCWTHCSKTSPPMNPVAPEIIAFIFRAILPCRTGTYGRIAKRLSWQTARHREEIDLSLSASHRPQSSWSSGPPKTFGRRSRKWIIMIDYARLTRPRTSKTDERRPMPSVSS
jgi:hypothetical protein